MSENIKKINAVVETNKNNFKNYSNPEIAAHIANIFVFPQKAPLYILKSIGILAVFGILLDVGVITFSNEEKYISALSSIFIFLLMIFSGVFVGIFFSIKKLVDSIKAILDYVNSLVSLIVNDIQNIITSSITDIKNFKLIIPSGHEIISGIFLDIILPNVKNIFENKIPLIGKLFYKLFSFIVNGMLKISKVFFIKVDKKIEEAIDKQIEKTKMLANIPVDFIEQKLLKIWFPMIIDGTNKYITKANAYVHRVYFLSSLPIILLASVMIAASISLTVLIL
jgi:hypothetical protein